MHCHELTCMKMGARVTFHDSLWLVAIIRESDGGVRTLPTLKTCADVKNCSSEPGAILSRKSSIVMVIRDRLEKEGWYIATLTVKLYSAI